MITRIVKMTFMANECEHFESIFKDSQHIITSMEGCKALRLWRDSKDTRIYFTYSIWESEQYLNSYRYSAFFKELWQNTKTLFAEKAQAWSVDELIIVK